MKADALQARFARAVEAEYARRAAAHRDAGASPEQAHERALEDASRMGRDALWELRRRGLFPWPNVEPDEVPTEGPDGVHPKRALAGPVLVTKGDAP